MKQKKLTSAMRKKHVAQMNASFSIEGFAPDETDKRLQQSYIEGSKSLIDLLKHANDFAIQKSGKK